MPITIAAPDLTITTASAPSSAIVGQSISVSWTVQNVGAVEAPGDWYDAVYVGSSPTFNANTDTYVESFYEGGQSPLAAGASYTESESIDLSTVPAGDEYLIFVTNYDGVLDEFYFGGAQAESDYNNNAYALPITITAPDLTITTASAPSSGIAGGSISVAWTVQNIGPSRPPATGMMPFISAAPPTFDLNTDTYLESFYEGGQSPLAAGASYTDNESIDLSSVPTGDEYLIFVANYEGVENEYYYGAAQGETNYTNNTYAVPIAVSAPDLTITTASAPSSGIEGQSVSVSWTVQNIGAVEAPGNWYDAVYIGATPTFDAQSDTFLADFSESSQSPLAAGASYTENESITLPTSESDGEYLIFVTNYEGVIGEFYDYGAQAETNYTNNTFALPITVKSPDLTITTASSPSSGIEDQPISVSWTVQNIGAGEAPGNWSDAVYIGSSPTFDPTTDTFIASFSESSQSPLAAGASYIDNESITLPTTEIGNEYLIFVTNDNAVENNFYSGEYQDETDYSNNTYAVPITVSAPDLTITTASAPSSGTAGQTLAVSWTVQNIGDVEAPGNWSDAVYFGNSPTLDPSSDSYLGSFSGSSQSPLAAGGSYVDDESLTLPSTASGAEYLIFVTNYQAAEGYFYEGQYQAETDYTNNTYALPIALPAADLTITSVPAIVGDREWGDQCVLDRGEHRHRACDGPVVRRRVHRQFTDIQRRRRHLHHELRRERSIAAGGQRQLHRH